MRKFAFILLLLLFSISSFKLTAQQHEIVFQQCYGGADVDAVKSLKQIINGKIIFGSTHSINGDISFNHGRNDLWLFKTDSVGTVLWENTYGGSDHEWSVNMLQTEHNGYLLFGSTFSDDGDVTGLHGGGDFWLVRTDSLGNLLWQKCLGGSCNDRPYQIIEVQSGGYICVGTTCSGDGDISYNHGAWDAWVVRLSESGEIIWERTYGGSGHDGGASITSTTDGGYLIAGATSSIDGDVACTLHSDFYSDVWLIKIDSTGEIEWQQCYGGTTYDEPTEIYQTSDGGYVLLGMTTSTDGDVSGFHGPGGDASKWDLWVVKLNATGEIEWQRCLGGYENEQPGFLALHPDGGYLVGGNSNSVDGDINCNESLPGTYTGWLVKLDASGEIAWQRCLGSQVNNSLTAIHILGQEHYLIGGGTRANGGDVDCDLKGQTDIWLVELMDTLTSLQAAEPATTPFIAAKPNPASTQTWLQLPESTALAKAQITLYSTSGMLLYKAKPSSRFHRIDVANLPKGLYLLRLWDGKSWMTDRLVVY